MTFQPATGSCVATVDVVLGALETRAKLVDLWAAAVAVHKMCVMWGQAGTAFRIGRCRHRLSTSPLCLLYFIPFAPSNTFVAFPFILILDLG